MLTAADAPDEIIAQGQVIHLNLSKPAAQLEFLGAATLGTQSGTITIHYADGSSQTANISFADWRAGHPASGGTVVATVPWNRIPAAAQPMSPRRSPNVLATMRSCRVDSAVERW